MWSAASQGFTAFADAAHIDYREHKAQILTDADAALLEPARQTARLEGSSHVDAWILARHGIPLCLATITEFHIRTMALDAREQVEDVATA